MYRLNGCEETDVDRGIATGFFSAGIGACSALVQFAHGVFDMLTQQATLVGRHMTVAATLIEIGGNGGTLVDVRCGTRRRVSTNATHRWFAARLASRRLRVLVPVCRRLGPGRHRLQCSRHATGKRQCKHGMAHCRPDPSHRFVPFLTRQTTTSITCTNPIRRGPGIEIE
jgi:hypothetical protein